MGQSGERRKSSRLLISSLIVCQIEIAEQRYHGELRDMSVSGCYMELDNQLHVPSRCKVEITLHGENSRLIIEGITGTVVRSDGNGAAIQFDTRMEWFALLSTYLSNIL